MRSDGTALAPDGYIWVCMACGKTSKTQYGFDDSGNEVSMQGWDESCMLNSELIKEDLIEERTPGGRVSKIGTQDGQRSQ